MVASGTKLHPDDDLAGNAPDSKSPGFNPAEKPRGGDGGSVDDYNKLLDKSDNYVAPQNTKVVGGEVVPKNPNSDFAVPDPNVNIKAVNGDEKNNTGYNVNLTKPTTSSTSQTMWGRLRAFGSNVGPTGSLGGFLGGGSILLFVIMSPGFVLLGLKENMHNAFDTNTRSGTIFSRALDSLRIGKGDCSKPGIRCKLTSEPKSRVDSYEKAGFKIEAKIVGAKGEDKGTYKTGDTKRVDAPGDRYLFKSVAYPDGSIKAATNGKDFLGIRDTNIDMRLAALRAFNDRAKTYMTKPFDYIGKNFHYVKSKILKPNTAKDPKATDESFNENTGLKDTEGNKAAGAADKTPKDMSDKIQEEAKAVNDKPSAGLRVSNIGTAALGLACGAYNISRITVATVKATKVAMLIAFAAGWLVLADQIKAQAVGGPDVNPDVVDNQVSKLTSYESNKTLTTQAEVDDANNGISGTNDAGKSQYQIGDPNPKYNLNASDAQGMRIATQGDKSALKDFALKWMIGGAGTLLVLSKALAGINKTAGHGNQRLGKSIIRSSCRAAGSVTVTAAMIALCGSGALEEGAGVVATLGGCLLAMAKQQAYLLVAKAISKKYILPLVVSLFLDLNLGSDLKGVDAGNPLAAGTGLLLGTSAASNGLEPSQNAQQTQDYLTYTQKYEDQYTEVAKLEAKSTPFDYTNKYSFLGSMVSSLNVQSDQSVPVLSGISSMLGLLPTAFATIGGSKVSAQYSQPVLAPTERYDCQDPDMVEIGIGTEGDITKGGADKFCFPSFRTPTDELQLVEDQALGKNNSAFDLIDWMSKSQTAPEKPTANDKPIDQSGGTLDDSNGCGTGTVDSALGSVGLGGDGSKECEDASTLPSIIADGQPNAGAPTPGSQYEKYYTYCVKRMLTQPDTPGSPVGTPDYWGTTSHGVEEGSNRDQLWFTGEQCSSRSKMMQQFRMYTQYCARIAIDDNLTHCWDDINAPTQPSTGSACDLLNNPNIVLLDTTKAGLKKICETGHATNSCGKDFTINPILINTMITLSSKYKIWVNNFGFQEDRFSCDAGQHPLGNAIDLNGIQKLDGSGTAGGGSWGGINYSASQVPVVKSYAEDWLAALPPNRGGVGQQGCGGFDVQPAPGATFVNGYMSFPDSCDHLHIDVRQRDNFYAQ